MGTSTPVAGSVYWASGSVYWVPCRIRAPRRGHQPSTHWIGASRLATPSGELGRPTGVRGHGVVRSGHSHPQVAQLPLVLRPCLPPLLLGKLAAARILGRGPMAHSGVLEQQGVCGRLRSAGGDPLPGGPSLRPWAQLTLEPRLLPPQLPQVQDQLGPKQDQHAGAHGQDGHAQPIRPGQWWGAREAQGVVGAVSGEHRGETELGAAEAE